MKTKGSKKLRCSEYNEYHTYKSDPCRRTFGDEWDLFAHILQTHAVSLEKAVDMVLSAR